MSAGNEADDNTFVQKCCLEEWSQRDSHLFFQFYKTAIGYNFWKYFIIFLSDKIINDLFVHVEILMYIWQAKCCLAY